MALLAFAGLVLFLLASSARATFRLKWQACLWTTSRCMSFLYSLLLLWHDCRTYVEQGMDVTGSLVKLRLDSLGQRRKEAHRLKCPAEKATGFRHESLCWPFLEPQHSLTRSPCSNAKMCVYSYWKWRRMMIATPRQSKARPINCLAFGHKAGGEHVYSSVVCVAHN